MNDRTDLRRVLRNQRFTISALCVVIVIMLATTLLKSFVERDRAAEPTNEIANQDSDHDGYTDVAERAAGTDPNDPHRYPGSNKYVLIARYEITEHTILTDQMISILEVPARGGCPPQTILAADRDRVVGHLSVRRIAQSDFITDWMVSAIRVLPADASMP